MPGDGASAHPLRTRPVWRTSVVTDNEDHVSLGPRLGNLGLTQVHTADPVLWNFQLAAGSFRSFFSFQTEQSDFELARPEDDAAETNKAWGEVRITEPGRDLQVTKLDIVPLQIEAAANQPLQRVTWRSAINQAAEDLHELPAPAEPRYAAYKPVIDLAALGLAEWDVLTYHAKADTASSNSFASEVYFLEVRRFDEDIRKMQGSGGGGNSYNFLKQLTELIRRQQHVIRETYRYGQHPHASSQLQAQDRIKLADAESDLGGSVRHISAEMAATLGDQAQPVLADLSQAIEPLAQASDFFRSNFIEEAQQQEREALQRLVATRKHFQKVVSENPEAFESDDEEQDPAPQQDRDQLKAITEFRNETKAAQDFLEKAVQKQEDITRRAASPAVGPTLAEEENTLAQSLRRFEEQHPKVARALDRPLTASHQSLTNAVQSLRKKSRYTQKQTQQALEQLKELSQAMRNQAASQQLADAYRLKQLLDKQNQSLGQCEQSPGSMTSAQTQQLAADAKSSLSQLIILAEQQPTREVFDSPLRDALNDKSKADVDMRLSRFGWAQDDETRRQTAGAAQEGLEKVSRAFEESAPEPLKAADKNDPLKPNQSESLEKGIAQLESLLRQLENNKSLSPRDSAKQGREALLSLQQGTRNLEGGSERTRLLLARLEEELQKSELPESVGDLRRLLEELQRISAEASDRRAAKNEEPEVTNIDAARLPPVYRARIEKYFQRLSEQSVKP